MKAFMNWSGGKDSGFCLYKAQQQKIAIGALVTVLNGEHDRVSMHGVRRSLLEQQAASIQLPLHTISLADQPAMNDYEEEIRKNNVSMKKQGFTKVVSGDLFLEDLKKYREDLYRKDNIDCLFPIWKINTKEMLEEFISTGFKAVIVCVNSSFLSKSFCGREIDHSFLHDLPSHVDPCGENGEYHSFVFDGPIFSRPLKFDPGEIVYKEYKSPVTAQSGSTHSGFYFQDLLPAL